MSDYELFDKLVREIEAAEAELARIQAASGKGAGGGVKAEAAELREEEAILRAEPLSGLVEDEQSRYYIAVGCIEKQLEDLRQHQVHVREQTCLVARVDLHQKLHHRDGLQMNDFVDHLKDRVGKL